MATDLARLLLKAPHLRIGEALVAQGYLTPMQRDQALSIQRQWGVRFGEVVQAKGWVRAYDFYRVLADNCRVRFVNLMQELPEPTLFRNEDVAHYVRFGMIPWREDSDGLTLACADPSEALIAWAEKSYSKTIRWVITSKFDIQWQIQAMGDDAETERAREARAEVSPEVAVKQTATASEVAWLAAAAAILVAGSLFGPFATLLICSTLLLGALSLHYVLRFALAWVGSRTHIDIEVTDGEVAALDERSLPIYTVLVPIYRDSALLPGFAAAIRAMDYPLAKLDVKLLLEGDDDASIKVAKELALESIFEIVRVPPAEPRTKATACNYGLRFARGTLLTVYDVAARPEPDQLKKAVVAFRTAHADVFCIQNRLTPAAAAQGWLARLRALEYTLRFDLFLPGLELLHIPIPLQTASNHCRLERLRELGGWGAYNSTDDVDLGVRLARTQQRTAILNSNTVQERSNRFPDWLRQQARWTKSHLQAWRVQMRHPLQLYRSLGSVGFWGLQFSVAGPALAALMGVPMWILIAVRVGVGSPAFDAVVTPLVTELALETLLVTNICSIALTTLAALRARQPLWLALTAPIYWFLLGCAAWLGVWQLLTGKPHGRKARHGR